MKGMQKKRMKKFLKSNPQYARSNKSYWRLQNGECMNYDGDKVFMAKAEQLRNRTAPLDIRSIPYKNSNGIYPVELNRAHDLLKEKVEI